MARSTVPPPPPAPEGDAGEPVPGTAATHAAKPPAKAPAKAPAKPAAKTSAATKPAAAAGSAATPAATTSASASPPASSAPVPVPSPVVEAARPDPYAPPPPAIPAGGIAPSPYAGAPAATPSTLSVLSLVFGIIGLVLSLFLVGLLPAIAGVILGHLALKREPHARVMAVGGLVTGYIGVAISVVWALVILVPLILVWIAIGAVGVTGGLTGGF